FIAPKVDAIATFTTLAPDRVALVAYPALDDDPAGAAAAVLAAGATRPVDLRPSTDAFLAAQRSGGRASPPSDLGSMGYDRDAVWADGAVGSYCSRFAIVPERTRLTGAPASS
ncbi:MAG TPA: hypothetical protein VMY34_01825, partial [Acidimicrobiales bacterium]|nr:hypothetical protein [Acidimicrobiales bacterium]